MLKAKKLSTKVESFSLVLTTKPFVTLLA